jgi:hypothetical protein
MHSDEHFEERRDALDVATGRKWSAPFAYVAIVATAVWGVAGLVALGAVLVWLFAS